jgi:DNA-binding XRE family transcriptional regulator
MGKSEWGYVMSDLQTYLDEALKRVKLDSINDEAATLDYNINSELSQLIIDTRVSLDMTQNQLAEKSGVSQSNISKIETGSYRPSVATLKKIADAFGKRLVIDFIDMEDSL